MKTPRDILFDRHQAACPKLDVIRHEVVAELNHQDTKAPRGTIDLISWCLGGFNKIWLELVFPSRRIWSGLATVWVLLFLINFFQRDASAIVRGKSSAEMTMTFHDQQKLLNELLADRSLPAEADRPRIFSPKPRTETANILNA